MKKNLLTLAVASATFIFAHPASAERNGWYAGVGFGQSEMSDWLSGGDTVALLDASASASGVIDFLGDVSDGSDDSDSAGKLFGGYHFTENFAIEASYVDLGEASARATANGLFLLDDGAGGIVTEGSLGNKVTSESQAVTLDAVGLFKVGTMFDVFAKVGLFYADSKLKYSAYADFDIGSASASDSISDKSTNLHYGLGANAWFTENLGIRLEWEQFNDVEVEDAESDISLLSASILYRF